MVLPLLIIGNGSAELRNGRCQPRRSAYTERAHPLEKILKSSEQKRTVARVSLRSVVQPPKIRPSLTIRTLEFVISCIALVYIAAAMGPFPSGGSDGHREFP